MPPPVFDTLLRPGDNCGAIAHANRVAMLVDAESYFDAFVRAAEHARRSLIMLGWDFDSRTVLRFDADGRPEITLGQFLNDLARKRRHLQIWMLDWDYPMVFGMGREFSPVYGWSWKPHRRVHFRYDNTHPVGGSHHQKIVVIDDKLAFAGGLDLTNKRWDSPKHEPGDPRRTFEEEPYPPFHDAMKYEGAQTIEMSFSVLGQVAMRELMSHPEVSKGFGELEGFISTDKIAQAAEDR